MKKLLFCMFATLAMSCNMNRSEEADNVMDASEIVTSSAITTPLFGGDERNLTPEQIELKRKMEDVFYFHTQVRNNKLELTVDEQYFIDNGIPVDQYDKLLADMKRTNDYAAKMEADGIEFDLAEPFAEAVESYKAFLEEYRKTGITRDEYIEKSRERHN